MTAEAAEPAPDAPPTDGHDAVGEHPDAAPPLESDQQQREDAAQAIRTMIQEDEAKTEAERAAYEGPQGASEEAIPDKAEDDTETPEEPAEEDEAPLDTDEEAQAQQQRREKPSTVREAMRRQKAARRDREATEAAQAKLAADQAAFEAKQAEFAQFQDRLQADPIGTLSRHLNLPPEQVLAQQADAQVNQVPPAVQAQLDAQAKEFADYKAGVEQEAKDRAEAARADNYKSLVNQDVSLLAGIAEKQDDAERYPHYASLSKATRERRALSILHYTHANMDNPEQYTQEDLWEALDEQAKEDHSSMVSSKWLKQTGTDAGQETPAATGKTPRRRRGGPSARGAAEPAPPRQPQTEAEAVEAAAAEIRRLNKEDDEKRR